MRVLFISNHFHPNHKGGGCYNRMLMFVEALKEVSHLDMLFYVSPDTDISPSASAEFEASLRRSWHPQLNLFLCPQDTRFAVVPRWKREVVSIFRPSAMTTATGLQQVEAFESCLERKPDLIFVHRLSSMSPALLTHRKLPPIFFDLDDIEHIKLARFIKYLSVSSLAPLSYLKIPTVFWAEYRSICLAHRTFICSNVDQNYLTHRLRLPGVVNLPNAVHIPIPQPITSNPTLLFLGTYGYLPNIQAANFLVEQVWPQIHPIIPEARLIIAGPFPENVRSYGKGISGVEFTGFVDDLEALYRRSRIVCCPIFAGGGTRVKIIEAAAYGKPIVASQTGVEGIDMKDEQELLQCDSPKQFAETCLKLLKDDYLCEQLGIRARSVAIQHYDRANIVKKIRQTISSEFDNLTTPSG
jgi:glycosyltransferase involved in cell wall biosynthesis